MWIAHGGFFPALPNPARALEEQPLELDSKLGDFDRRTIIATLRIRSNLLGEQDHPGRLGTL